ncbi:hypothetical protein L204_102518 [Cryptococcus depauperatus]|nr:serine/threonine protein kinase [Cryptococcus depauperatus CBS 7855]
MTASPVVAPSPILSHHSPIPSPRRVSGPSSPPPPTSSRTSVALGFSPVAGHSVLPAVPESVSSPVPPPLVFNSGAAGQGSRRMSTLSPQLTTPVEQVFHIETSPRPQASSPRAGGGILGNEYLPRSRRNSAAIVSISLSSRSRSKTPRGSTAALPGQRSTAGTPSKTASTNQTPKPDDLFVPSATGSGSWAPGVEELDDWQPAGGMLLSHDDENALVDDEFNFDNVKFDPSWSGGSDVSRVVEDALTPGMIIGEGLKFQGEIIVPAVSRMALADGSDIGLPLRRGGSEATKVVRGDGRTEKKRYEVVRRLGTGSYAVVYLVKEKGGRKEYALKCLSKHDLADEQLETQLFEAHIHLSLPIHQNIVTLHQTLQTRRWLFLMLELCPGEDLFYWLEKSRDASPQPNHAALPEEQHAVLSSSKLSSSSIPFSSSQMFSNLTSMSFSQSPGAFSQVHSYFGASPAGLIFAHNNNGHHNHSHSHFPPSQTPPTPSLLSAFSANTLLSQRRLRLIASMFSQMCEAVAVCHDAGVSHRDIKPENFICCDSIELEEARAWEFEDDDEWTTKPVNFGSQAKRKVVVKLTDFGLATTEKESGDVECGSRPYMSYECRNNLGPTYFPAPADVWSLGIVLINMLFHRNPWKDPTPGDPNFDNFLMDPIGFILSKFTGIGREVASYLADHVLCIDVENRITAKEFGLWIKGLPEMIGGRKALHSLKLSRLETQKSGGMMDKGVFMKSPVHMNDKGRKCSTSALTSSAPVLGSTPMLSGLPSPSSVLEQLEEERESPVQVYPEEKEEEEEEALLRTPPLEHDRVYSAATSTTVDEQTTPIDDSSFPSPSAVVSDGRDDDQSSRDRADADSRSLSTHKRRKRGVRKGKAAQAAAAAAAAANEDKISQASRDALLHELASASQSLAREMSKFHKPLVDVNRIEDFPPLGVTSAQVASEKKSKWKGMMKFSQGNPELAALAKRVKERNADDSLNMSAPAQLQGGKVVKKSLIVGHTATFSSDVSSVVSSFGQTPSVTSIGEDDDKEDRGREKPIHFKKTEENVRAKKAAQAAAAIAGDMGPMGSFGRPSNLKAGPRHAYTTGLVSTTQNYPIGSSKSIEQTGNPHTKFTSSKNHTTSSLSSSTNKPSLSSVNSSTTIRTSTTPITTQSSSGTTTINDQSSELPMPNKPKLKGQISTLAKMLSGLKTKGKE